MTRRLGGLLRTGGLLVLLAGLLVGCGSATSGSSSATSATEAAAEVRIAAKDDFFDPKTVTVPAGRPVKVTFVNEGQHVHEVEIKGLVNETKLQPGQSKSFTITPQQQVYKLYCEIHEDQGMVGEFIGQ